MKKTAFIIVTIIVILLILIVLTLLLKGGGTESKTPQYTDIGGIQDGPAVVVDTEITLHTEQGQKTVPNFLSGDEVFPDTDNQGYYFIGNTFDSSVAEGDPTFVITFESDTSFFNIALLQEPLRTARLDAEAHLQNVLGLTDEEMCSLNYTLSVPGYINEEYSGADLRFSFCQDSVSLP